MPDLTAKRTLVKSPPELWEELSEVERLAKHLGAFGEITITKLEPEHTVAWEGERASGTVSIEPSGWGTKVTLRAELPETDEPEPEPEPDPAEPAPAEPASAEPASAEPASAEPAEEAVALEPEARVEPEPVVESFEEAPGRGFWGWLFRRRTGSPPVPADPAAGHEPDAVVAVAVAEPEAIAASDPEPETLGVEPDPEPVAAEPSSVPEPEVAVDAEPEPDAAPASLDDQPQAPDAPAALDPERARLILDEALDTLGAAHHRPFSRG
jgi:hypothetical protein